jgi:hypothetical protein
MDLRAAVNRLPVDRALDAFMASHYGLIDHDSVSGLGGTAELIRRNVVTGRWLVEHRMVYRAAAAPRTPEQELLAAVWASGDLARASHLSGTWAWGLLARPPDLPEVSIPYARSVKHRGIVVHRSTDLAGVPLHERRGIPVTDPARTILDVTGVVPHGIGTMLVDRAISTKLVTVDGLVAVLERFGRRGRRGSGTLRTILEERGVAAVGRTPTVLESRMARIARSINAPPPVAEYPVANGHFRFDFAWPEVKVAAEVHGWDGHAAYDDWVRNIDKRHWADDHDWLVLEWAWEHVKNNPDLIAHRLAAALARRTLILAQV